MTSMLFKPLSIGGMELENCITIAPMCQYSAIDGSMTDWHLMHLGSLALSGAAMLVIEATGVTPEGRITPNCTGLYSDANEAAMARVVKFVRSISSIRLGIQLAHAQKIDRHLAALIVGQRRVTQLRRQLRDDGLQIVRQRTPGVPTGDQRQGRPRQPGSRRRQQTLERRCQTCGPRRHDVRAEIGRQ